MAGQLAKDIWDRATRTGGPGKVSLDACAWTGQRGQDCQEMRAVSGELWTIVPGQKR
jgi:hypothetical protein